MHHPDHHGGGCPKCVINIRQIAALARLLANTPSRLIAEISELANVAEAAVGMLDARGFTVSATPKVTSKTKAGAKAKTKAALTAEPCEHALKLMAWITGAETPDAAVALGWRDEILADIAELVGVESVDPHHGEGG